MFEAFSDARIDVGDGVAIRTRVAGDGPPVLLLHGYPQTHACWHRVAPRLATAGFTVVATDLRGYGDSSKPASTPDHATYAKRAMAADQLAVMRALGHDRFAVAGHDRGGRVAHRMALDHARGGGADRGARHRPDGDDVRADRHGVRDRLLPLVLPDPAGAAARAADRRRAGVLPARQARRLGPGRGHLRAGGLAEYLRCFADPATIAATCEDYRAAATIDLEHDAADAERRIEAPLLVLWGERGLVGRSYDVLATWREKATDVRGHALPTGHYLPEEAPEAVAEALIGFFAGLSWHACQPDKILILINLTDHVNQLQAVPTACAAFRTSRKARTRRMAKSPARPYALAMHRATDLSGIVAMVAATAAFVVGDSFMKLVTEDLPPFEVLFLAASRPASPAAPGRAARNGAPSRRPSTSAPC